MADGQRRRAAAASLTVQGWQYLVLSVMGLAVLVGGLAVTALLHRTDQVTEELLDQLGPARVAAYQVQAALRDQETAVRGYLISGDPQFLEPYTSGRAAEERGTAELRRLEQARPDLLSDLDVLERSAQSWRANYAEKVVASVQSGGPTSPVPLIEVGKTEFDRLRALFDTQNTHLMQARAAAADELDHIRAQRNAVLLALVAAFAVTIVVLAVLMRRAVVRPLDALAAACRRITEGNFAERIEPRGPRDIRAIGFDVEYMRHRIVEELEASRAATEALDVHAEELRRSNAELEQFAYVASHDLQEPLRKVTSFCQLLERRYGDKLDDRATEYIAFAVDGAKRMQVLINDLLTFSRVGRLNVTESDVDLGAALDTALANLATAIGESDAVIDRPPDGLPTVKGDPTLLSMLWQNLVGNAVKFRRPDVAPRIVIECRRSDADGPPMWSFALSDNGIGIAPEFSEKVFVIFQRLHGRDAYTGTGIGLALCKKIVETHGGTIVIDNEHTGGTRFVFTLPVRPDDADASAETDDRAAPHLEGSAP
jgi:signal transduction histidine kinase